MTWFTIPEKKMNKIIKKVKCLPAKTGLNLDGEGTEYAILATNANYRLQILSVVVGTFSAVYLKHCKCFMLLTTNQV